MPRAIGDIFAYILLKWHIGRIAHAQALSMPLRCLKFMACQM